MTEGRIVKTQQNPLFLRLICWVQVDVNPYWRCLLISGSKVRALVRPPSKSKTYRKVDSLGNCSREEEERILALKGCDAVCGLMRVKALALAERLRCTRCFVTEDAYRSLAAHSLMLNPQSKVLCPATPDGLSFAVRARASISSPVPSRKYCGAPSP